MIINDDYLDEKKKVLKSLIIHEPKTKEINV